MIITGSSVNEMGQSVTITVTWNSFFHREPLSTSVQTNWSLICHYIKQQHNFQFDLFQPKSSAHLITLLRHQLHPPSAPVHTNWEPVWLRERDSPPSSLTSARSAGVSHVTLTVLVTSQAQSQQRIQWYGGMSVRHTSHPTLWSADVLAWGLESVRTREQTTHTNRPGNHQ